MARRIILTMKRLDYFFEMLKDILASLDSGSGAPGKAVPIGRMSSSGGCEEIVFGYMSPAPEGARPDGKAYIALRHEDGVYQFEEWQAGDYLEPENYSHGESLDFPDFMERITDAAGVLGIDWMEDSAGRPAGAATA